MAITVVIADDHPVVCSGIRNILSCYHEFQVIGEACNGEEALKLVLDRSPDVLLLDICMPGMQATQVVQKIKCLRLPTKVLILTFHKDPKTILTLLKAGVDGYIFKEEGPAVIMEAIFSIMKGCKWFGPAVKEIVVSRIIDERPDVDDCELSERERQVLCLMAEGKSNSQIINILKIAEGTVKNHVSNIFAKLRVNRRSEAVSWAWRNGIIDKEADRA